LEAHEYVFGWLPDQDLFGFIGFKGNTFFGIIDFLELSAQGAVFAQGAVLFDFTLEQTIALKSPGNRVIGSRWYIYL